MEQTNSNLNSNKTQTVKSNTNLAPPFLELTDHKFFGIILSKTQNISSEKLKIKVLEILKTINCDKINFYKLSRHVFEGLPDDIPSLRSLAWKILFKYVPLDVNIWEELIDKKRGEYYKEKKLLYDKLELEIILKKKSEVNSHKDDDLNSNLENITLDSEIKSTNRLKKKKTTDHPLNLTKNSKWKSYFDDLELLEEIEKDVRRTRTHMHFFFMPAKTNLLPISNEKIT